MRLVSLLTALFFTFSAPLAYAADLVNINTADVALLDTLPHVGPSTAQKIIDYRTAHGPFATIEDIQNVSGIGPAYYADIAPLITVGEVPATTPPAAGEAPPAVATSTPQGRAATYVPPPAAILVQTSGPDTAFLEVPIQVSARVTTKSGAADTSARVVWSFGDGSSAEGSVAEKVYHYAGTYLVVATASDGTAVARDEFVVEVKPTKVRLLPVSSAGITVANDSTDRLDLSGWWLRSSTGSFRIPQGTTILPESSALFPFAITNLPFSTDATLLYPSGVTVVSVAPIAAVQPLVETPSYKQVQSVRLDTVPARQVEPIISTRTNVQSHVEAVLAPTAATELAAVGAPLAAQFNMTTTTERTSKGLLRSPWTLGLLGVIALAGTAFILL